MTRRHLVGRRVLNSLEEAVQRHLGTIKSFPEGWDWKRAPLETDHDWILSQAAHLLNKMDPPSNFEAHQIELMSDTEREHLEWFNQLRDNIDRALEKLRLEQLGTKPRGDTNQ